MHFNNRARNKRVSIEAEGKRSHAHAVIDFELQWLHALAHLRADRLSTLRILLVGESAHLGERVINIAAELVVDHC